MERGSKSRDKIYLTLTGIALVMCLVGMGIALLALSSGGRAEEWETVAVEDTAEEPGSPYFHVEEDMELLKKYQEYNSDVVALIRIPDTVLNHPVMQTPNDEEYYLLLDLDKNYNSHGIPFLSKDSQMEGRHGNRIIYGHNIHKRSRDIFADLAGYEDLEFYKEHPVIQTVSKSGTRNWLIFAYFIVDNADTEPFRYSDTTKFLSKQQFDTYFGEVEKRNWLDVPVEYGMEDTFLTLSSCSNELAGSGTNRMVVIAKELLAGEEYDAAVSEANMAEAPLLPERLQK